jgi:hypothetical protein
VNAAKYKEISGLWTSTSGIWSTIGKDERKREVLELFCGALWYIQKAYELGNISTKQLKSLISERVGGKTPWQLWVETGDWFQPNNVNFNWTIQSMFIADAILRLEAIRDVMRRKCKVKIADLENTILPKSRKVIEGWFAKVDFPGKKPNILGQLTVMAAFRDTVMHGEQGQLTDCPKYSQFRENGLRVYSLADISKYSLEIASRFLRLVPHLEKVKDFCTVLKAVSS